MTGGDIAVAEAELRRAIAAFGEVPPFAGDVVTGLQQVEQWLDVGELELAYEDLVTIAEDTEPGPEVWAHLLRAQRSMNLRSDDPGAGRYVRSVEAMTAPGENEGPRPMPPDERAWVGAGSARNGCLAAASYPFGSMAVQVDAVELKVSLFGRETLRRGEGRIIVREGRLRTSVRFVSDEDGKGSIVFRTWDRSGPRRALERFGWGDAVILTGRGLE